MTVSRDAAGPCGVGRKTLSALCGVGLLTMLGACAAENLGGVATSAAPAAVAAPVAAPAAPAAAPVAAAAAPAAPTATAATTTAAAAPQPAPQVLTPTEINERCWTSNEVNKLKDLDAKARYVDKCVAEKMKAQGM